MRLKIRKKMLLCFTVVVLVMFFFIGIIVAYNHNAVQSTIRKIDLIAMELRISHNLSVEFERIAMPANDYIITGKPEYLDKFHKQSQKLQKLLNEARFVLTGLKTLGFEKANEELVMLKELEDTWQEAQELSMKILAVPAPVGNSAAASMMERLDYQILGPATARITRWYNIDVLEMTQAVNEMNTAWRRSWIIMGCGAIFVIGLGLFLAFMISKKLTRPMLELYNGSKAIANGEFGHRIAIQTGDELEQLGTAFNKMALSLQETLNAFKNSETRYKTLIENANDIILLIDPGTKEILEANSAAGTILGYTADELRQLKIDALYPKEKLREYMNNFKKFMVSDGGELPDAVIIKKDGTALHVDIMTSVADLGKRHLMLCSCRDISERKELERVKEEYTKCLEGELSISQDRLQKIAYTAMDALIMIDSKATVLFWNPAAEKIFGYSKEEALNRNMIDLIVPERFLDKLKKGFRLFGATGNGPMVGKTTEMVAKKKDGTEFPISHSINAVRVSDGWGAVGIIRDITDRKQAEEKLYKANRLYATLSQVNQAIVRERDRQKLFKEICNIAIKFGKFKFAWIGMLDEKTQIVEPTAFSGEGSDYLHNIKISLSDDLAASGPTGRSIREGRSIVFNDLANNPEYQPWREHALAKGYRSSAAFPIKLNDKSIGALNVYAIEPRFFDEAEINLLEEAALDISFALQRIKDENDRKVTESVNMELGNILEGSLNEIYVFDAATMKFIHVNAGACRNLGYSIEELQSMSTSDIKPEFTLESFTRRLEPLRTGEKELIQFETIHRRKNGSTYPVEVHIQSSTYESAPAYVAIILDITERRKADEQLRKFEHIVSSSTDMMALIDREFTYMTANRAYLDAFNKTLNDIIGHTVEEILGKKFFNEMILPNAELCLTGKKVNHKTWINFPNHEPRYMDIHYYPYYSDGTEVIGFAVNGRDITGQKRIEEQILQETEITKNLLRLSGATAKTADIGELVQNVVEITREITGARLVLSYLWDSGTKTFRPGNAAGLTRKMWPLFKTIPIDLGVTSIRFTMDTGRIFVDSDKAGKEPLKLRQEGLFDWVEDARSISILPLVGKREYLGLIVCIYYKDSGNGYDSLPDRKRVLMQAIASQVSTALEEALHYRESISRAMELSQKVETIETMSEISKSILSTLDADEIFEVTARMVSRLLPCDWVRIIEVDRVKNEFRFMMGFEDGGVIESIIVPFTSTSLTEVIYTKRPEYISDLRKVEPKLIVEKELVERGYLSILRIPIIVKGEVTGVLGLMSRRTSAFNSQDLSTLEKLSGQVGVALENSRLVTDLEEFSVGAITALAATIDAKSPWTRGHSERVTEIALEIGREVGLNEKELKEFRIAGLLHDIGKIGTNESILDKTGQLTEQEFEEIRKHPGAGADILANIKPLRRILPTIRGHHEYYDGTGYPDGLKSAEIPFCARILTVADTVDAMGADRPYRKGMSQEKVSAELKRCSGTQFDPEIVKAYFKTLEKKNKTLL